MIRPTIAYFLSPNHFLDSDFNWHDFKFERWSKEDYEWVQDDWNGLKDTVKEPVTVLDEYGDCDDYSVVALSKLTATTDNRLYLVALYSVSPLAGHMIAYDSTEERIYSSGHILDKTLEEYKSDTKYSLHISRKVQ